jgi:hypothetical protein
MASPVAGHKTDDKTSACWVLLQNIRRCLVDEKYIFLPQPVKITSPLKLVGMFYMTSSSHIQHPI